MSAEYFITDDAGKEIAEIPSVTYNLGPMLRSAGFPPWDRFVGTRAWTAQDTLKNVLWNLLKTSRKFRLMEPSNGFGTYIDAVEFIVRFAIACSEYPDGTIGASL